MADSLAQILNRLRPKLGAWEAPTHDGWVNFEKCWFEQHKKKWVFGINVRKSIYKCMSCGRQGPTHALGLPVGLPRLARGRLAPSRLAPSDTPAEVVMPWKRIGLNGRTRALEEGAINYLRSRGIPRMRAAQYGLGYGTEGVWIGYVIHPYYDDGGAIRGWQGRLQGEPDEGFAKVRTTSPKKDGSWVWGAYDGAVYNLDRVEKGAVLAIAEGPYDALSIDRVTPAVALLGSNLSDTQMYRILRKKPQEIVVAFDQDKTEEMKATAAKLFKRTHVPVFWVDYHAGWDGDWAAAPNGAPRCVDSVYEEIHHFTRLYEPGQ